MKIQIASDLHIDFEENGKWLKENPLVPKGDVLVLAGDTVADQYRDDAESFYEFAEKNFKYVVEVPGNHEFYGGHLDSAYPDMMKQINNRYMLNNKSVVLEGVKFICTILWSYVPPESRDAVEMGLNDYRAIYMTKNDELPITSDVTNTCNKNSIEYIRKELEKPFDGKIVVVTHHLPSNECVHEKYKNSSLNPGFANNLDDFIKKYPQITLWVHGHSHTYSDVKIGATRVVGNPLGYVMYGENKGFRRDLAVEL